MFYDSLYFKSKLFDVIIQYKSNNINIKLEKAN